MAIFAFLKKSRDSSIISSTTKKSGDATKIFKGDLAFIRDADVFSEEKLNEAEHSFANMDKAKDSSDSIIYMSFAPEVRNMWICPECGTRNENNLNGCVVCGLKR